MSLTKATVTIATTIVIVIAPIATVTIEQVLNNEINWRPIKFGKLVNFKKSPN